MSNTITISFRAKREEFAGGIGYKVPALTGNHVDVADRDTLGVTILGSLDKQDITKARLRKFAGLDLPGVVWANGADILGIGVNHEAWQITPVGNGFMADITITLPLGR